LNECTKLDTPNLGVGEEGVRPPDLVKHLVTDAQLLLALVKREALVVPELAEVKVDRVVLATNGICVFTSNITPHRIQVTMVNQGTVFQSR
jgi:hypothetical protein